MEIRVEITGIAEVLRQLDGLVSAAALREGLAAAAHLVEGRAKIKAPVDTGFLRNSIGVVSVTSREAVIGVGAEYGVYQEMGTRFMRAQPFMRPALENNREAIAGLIRDALLRGASR
jgi:HK97 gp10 family phage protein